MARLLHVSASPMSSRSFSGRVAAAFVEAWRVAHPGSSVDELNVWTEPLPAFDAMASSWKVKVTAGQMPTEEEVAAVQPVIDVCTRFLEADHYLFSVPMWNFSVPYTLKHYLDVIVQPGITMAFDPRSGFVGLVPPDRPVQLVLSRGNTAYTPGGMFDGHEFQESYLRAVLGFIGLTDVRSIILECTAYPTEVREPRLAAAFHEAEAAAPTF
ncbi:FMN-dependent NADH-azoreductase [Ornithinimicrobium sufpigmenti]|nr:NAD(P)H-dependent oxidoreductase [Ornithinimicrobium sp. HY008]